MKPFSFLVAIIILAFANHTYAQKVFVTKDGLIVNGTKIGKRSKARVLDKPLGEADKVHELANNIYTYDDLGVYVYFDPSSGNFESFAFNFVHEDFDFAPEELFNGKFKVGGKKIGKKDPIGDMKKVKGVERESFMGIWYIYKYYDMTMYFSIDDDKNVTSISINYSED